MVSVLAVLAAGTSAVQASEMDGGKLFSAKCAICHSMTQPTDESKVVAPPARGIMFHMSEAFKGKEEIKAHINDFVLAPSKEKAICKSVKRFGVMPSQKGAVSKEELAVIAEWMTKNLMMDKAEHDQMEKGHKGNKGKNNAFDRFDEDRDGKLSKEEFEKMRNEMKGQSRGQGKGNGKGKHSQGGCDRG